VHETKPGVIVLVRAYDAESGRYLWDVALGEDDDNMRVPELRQPTPVRRGSGVITPPPTRRGNSGTRADTTRSNRGNAGVRADTTRSNRGNAGVRADTTRSNRGNAGGGVAIGANTGSRGGNAGDKNRGNAADTAATGRSGRGGEEGRGRQANEPPPGRPGDNTPLGSGGRIPLAVQAEYFPRPGQCRVWFPDRPAAQQARPAGCSGISRRAPAGAWILRRTRNDPNVIFVDYIDADNGGVIVKTSAYDAATSRFLRDEAPPQR
jgi:hypothetical protein